MTLSGKKRPMTGRICLVTGATSGIGKVTAHALAEQGATVVVASRNERRCRRTVRIIRRRATSPFVDHITADLSSKEQVRRLAEQFKKKYPQLDVLVNNAGAMFVDRRQTVDGYEMTFALNHLAYFLLTHLLSDSLKASGNARVVNVSSSAHFACPRINFKDLHGQKNYDGKRIYAQSKLANVLFSYELARRFEGTRITSNALEPGGVITRFRLNNGLINWARHVGGHLITKNLVGPKKGAMTSIYLATSPEVEGVNGKYYSRQKAIPSSKASYDLESARRLWQVSLEMTDIPESSKI
jgi:NAD(P)-dependent dehydrogenase (short-subunit alcohol dehydrogenase family)